MGRRTTMKATKSHTLPSSPSHSSSSSDFEFTVSLSPMKSTLFSTDGGNTISGHGGCPADDLFYKGQLLPLHLSPRLSMVRTLLLSSSSTSSSSTATTSRPSSGSSTDCDSSRPSSAAEDDCSHSSTGSGGDLLTAKLRPHFSSSTASPKKFNKYFSLSKFSSVFRPKSRDPSPGPGSGSSVKRISATAREVICKYLKKVKPLYEKLSQKEQNQKTDIVTAPLSFPLQRNEFESTEIKKERVSVLSGISFSWNLRYQRRRSCISSCPSSMRSSPSHSGILSTPNGMLVTSSSSSMEELQNAIQGAIAHCKNSMSKSNIEI